VTQNDQPEHRQRRHIPNHHPVGYHRLPRRYAAILAAIRSTESVCDLFSTGFLRGVINGRVALAHPLLVGGDGLEPPTLSV
jgi:hypothetical protein